MKQLVPVFAALALAACGPKSTPPPPPGPTAGLGQAGEVNGLRFRPLEVIEDSRCPARVQCVWAGRLVLHLTAARDEHDRAQRRQRGQEAGVAERHAESSTSSVPDREAGRT